ncbi:MAG: AbgT family transporter [Oculatellaceae cyanobacterium Prado106]|jgi:aminobenzoyl-glutamate transport protein|nr:AbgT family transporter [Oculatellaceae cyanobacterium Prado106]
MTQTPPQAPNRDTSSSGVVRILDGIEALGNKLPDPITLFFILCLIVVGVSAIAGTANLSVVNPANQETVTAVSLLTPNGLRRIVSEALENFVAFPPLGTTLVALLGVGVAEYTGLLGAALRQLVQVAPVRLISPVVVFAGVMSNVAGDAGYVVLVPLGAVTFLAFRRHPLAGLAAAFSGVAGGFSANLLISPTDALLSGLSQSAAQLIDPNYTVNATSNYYFMVVSTLVVTLVGWYITDKVVEPRLGTYSEINSASETTQMNAETHREQVVEDFSEGDRHPANFNTTEPSVDPVEEGRSNTAPLSAVERKGLRWAGYSLLAFIALILALLLPPQGILRDPETFTLIPSPFIEGIVFMVAIAFFIPGVVYGKVTGFVQSDKEVAQGMAQAMSSMGYYLALAFMAAQFVAYFNWSNLGIISAVSGAEFLRSTGIAGPPLFVCFILLSVLLDLFIGSASAKWAIMAPIFVPMFMLVGYSPASVQAAYRIGDSTTNIITPLMLYFPMVVAFGQRYDKNLGIGKLISIMLPYSLSFLVAWSLLFVIWFVLGLPLGPGAGVQL